jgi:hypothetical protein
MYCRIPNTQMERLIICCPDGSVVQKSFVVSTASYDLLEINDRPVVDWLVSTPFLSELFYLNFDALCKTVIFRWSLRRTYVSGA